MVLFEVNAAPFEKPNRKGAPRDSKACPTRFKKPNHAAPKIVLSC